MTLANLSPGLRQRSRVRGLDTIRFVAAMWVVFGHFGGIPLLSWLDRSHAPGRIIGGLYNNFFSGPSAVIVFFVISGFCIHHSYASGAPFRLRSFLFRRYTRVAFPMAAAIVLAHWTGMELRLFEKTILWSLVAELGYYTLYPVIRRATTPSAKWALLVGAYFASLAVVLTQPGAGDYPSYGWQMNWLLGLPCWLLGLRLADQFSGKDSRFLPCPSRADIWVWRAGIWMLSILCSILRFHSPLGYPWTLNLFAIAVYYWLMREILWNRAFRPWGLLEWAGTWSYSIYLVHPTGSLAFYFLLTYFLRSGLPEPGIVTRWAFEMTIILMCSYAFYVLVERPAHQCARAGAHWLSRDSTRVSAR